MTFIIRKKSGVVIRKSSTNTIIDRSSALFSMLIVKSVVEGALKLAPEKLPVSSRKIMFYPVWTMKRGTKEKIVKKIAVKLETDTNYTFLDKVKLTDYGLMTYEELMGCFIEAGATHVSGLQDFYTRFRINDRRSLKE
jgi:hypothetical protein